VCKDILYVVYSPDMVRREMNDILMLHLNHIIFNSYSAAHLNQVYHVMKWRNIGLRLIYLYCNISKIYLYCNISKIYLYCNISTTCCDCSPL